METENFNLDPIPATVNYISSVEDKPQDETNSKWEKGSSYVLSRIYLQLLVILTVLAVFTEVLHGPIPLFYIHVYFYFYLLGGSILFLVSSFVNTYNFNLNDENVQLELREKNNSHLRRYFIFGLVVCGAAAFTSTCLGAIATFFSRTCISYTSSIFHILQTAFIILQLPFFFFANVLNFARNSFHKIGIVHLVATNVSLWLYILLWESAKDWQEALHVKHNSIWGRTDINITMHSLESDIKSLNQSGHLPNHVVHVTSNCFWQVVPELLPVDIVSVDLCFRNSSVGRMWKKTFDCFYPIIVQYYLIVLFLLYIMWKDVTVRCKNQCSSVPIRAHNTSHCFFLSKGFYFGCIFFIASIVIVVLNFILDIPNFDAVLMTMLCVIFASAVFAVLVGFCQMEAVKTFKLSNQSFINCYQEIGICFVYVYGASNLLVGCLSAKNYIALLLIESFFMILHAVSQYIFINSVIKSRQAVNFLILCNASLWILESFMFCYNTLDHSQLQIYGTAWLIMNRIIVPCLAFYRFYSAVLFLNISKFLSV